MINFFKKTDKSILIVMILIVICIAALLIDTSREKEVHQESFKFQDDSKKLDVASELANLKRQQDRELAKLKQQMLDNRKELEDQIHGFNKSNVLKIEETSEGEKTLTLKNGDIYKIKVGRNGKETKELIGSLFEERKKGLGDIIKEIRLPNGDLIIETADGKIWLLKKDGSLIELTSYTVDADGNYILYTKDGQILFVSKDGIKKAIATDDGYILVDTEPTLGVDGNLFIQEADGVYMIDENGNKVLVGEEMFKRANGDIYIRKADGVYKLMPDGTWQKVADEIFQDENGNLFVKTEDGVFKVMPDGSLQRVGDEISVDENGNIIIDGKIVGKEKTNFVPILDGSTFDSLKEISTPIKEATLENGVRYIQEADGVYMIDENGNKIRVGDKLTIDANGNVLVDGKPVGTALTYKDLNNAVFDAQGNLIFSGTTLFDDEGNEYLNKIFEDENGKYIMTINGEKIYVKDAWFDEEGNLIYLDENGDKHILRPGREVFLDPRTGKIILSEIFEDENGKYLMTADGEKIYVNDAWFDEDGNLVYIDKDGVKHVLDQKFNTSIASSSDGLNNLEDIYGSDVDLSVIKDRFLDPRTGKVILNEIFEDENGKYLLTADGEKIYVNDAWFDENGNLVYIDKDGVKHVLDQKVGTLDYRGTEFIDGIFEDENGKYLLTTDGKKVYVNDAYRDENGNIVFTDKNGNLHTLKFGGNEKIFKLSKDVKSAIGEDGFTYVQEADGVYRIDKFGNKVRVGDTLTIDENGNIVIDGNVISKSVSVEYFEEGVLEILGLGTIFQNINGDSVISFEKIGKHYIGKFISSFTDNDGNFFQEVSGSIYKNNQFFDTGKMFFNHELNSVNVFENQKIKRTIKGVSSFEVGSSEFTSKDGSIYKIFDMRYRENNRSNIKRGSILEFLPSGEIKKLGEGKISFKNGRIKVLTNNGVEINKEFEPIDFSKTYHFNEQILVDKDDSYILINTKKPLLSTSYKKSNTKLTKVDDSYKLITVSNKPFYLGDLVVNKNIRIDKSGGFQIDNFFVKDGVISNSPNKLNSENSTEISSFVLNDSGIIVFNINKTNSVVFSKNKQINLSGVISSKNSKVFLTPRVEEINLGKIEKISNLINVNGDTLFINNNKNYSVDSNGILELSDGEFVVENNAVYKVLGSKKDFVGDLSYSSSRIFNGLEFNASGSYLDREGDVILPKKGNYVTFGEIIILEGNKRVFYNEGNEVISINKMSTVSNLGIGNLIIYKMNEVDKLYMLQNGTYDELGTVIRKDTQDNMIYKTTKGLYYLINNNINQIDKNILYDLKLIPEVSDGKLFGYDKSKEKIFLGDILNILTGVFDSKSIDNQNNLTNLTNISKIVKDESGDTIVIDENGNKVVRKNVTVLPSGDIKVVDSQGNEIIISKNKLNSSGKNFLVEGNILDDLVKIYQNNKGEWTGLLKDNSIIRLKSVEAIDDGNLIKVTDYLSNTRIFSKSEIFNQEMNLNIGSNPLIKVKEIFKDSNNNWFYIDFFNIKRDLSSVQFVGNGDVLLIDTFQNSLIIKKQYISEKINGFLTKENELDKVVSIIQEENSDGKSLFAIDNLGYKINLSEFTPTSKGFTISSNTNNKRDIKIKDVINEIDEYVLFDNPLNKSILIEKIENRDGWFSRTRGGENSFISNVSELPNGDLKVFDDRNNVLILHKENFARQGNVISIIENELSNISKIEINNGKIFASNPSGKTIEVSNISYNSDGNLIISNNQRSFVVDKSNILSFRKGVFVNSVKSFDIMKIYKESDGYFSYNFNNKKDKVLNFVENDLGISFTSNGTAVSFSNKNFVNLTDVFFIKSNVLDDIITIENDKNDDWFGYTEKEEKIKLKKVIVLENGDFEIHDDFGNIRVISKNKLISKDRDTFYIEQSFLDDITILSHDNSFNQWSSSQTNEPLNVIPFNKERKSIISNDKTRIIHNDDLKIVSRNIEFTDNPLNKVVKIISQDGVLKGVNKDNKIIPGGEVVLTKENGYFKLVQDDIHSRFISSSNIKKDENSFIINSNDIDSISSLKFKDDKWEYTTFEGVIKPITSVSFKNGLFFIIDGDNERKIISTQDVKKDFSNFSVFKNPIDKFVKIVKQNNVWSGFDISDNQERLINAEVLKDGSLLVKNQQNIEKLIHFSRIKSDYLKGFDISLNDLSNVSRIFRGEDGNYYAVDKNGNLVKLNLVEEGDDYIKIIDENENERIINKSDIINDGESFNVNRPGEIGYDDVKSIENINGNFYLKNEDGDLNSIKNLKEKEDGGLSIVTGDNKNITFSGKEVRKEGTGYVIIRKTNNEEGFEFLDKKDVSEIFDGKVFEDKKKKPTNNQFASAPTPAAKPSNNNPFGGGGLIGGKVPRIKVISSPVAVTKNNEMFGPGRLSSGRYNGDSFYGYDDEHKFMIPMGSTLDATLKSGSMAVLGENGSGDTDLLRGNKAMFVINRDIITEDGTIIPLRGAQISATPIATNIKRMVFELENIYFYDESVNKWMTSAISGQVVFKFDGVPGIPGIILDKKDEYLAKATIYSVLEGVTEFMVATKSPINAITDLTDDSSVSSSSTSVSESLVGGMGDGLASVQESLLQLARERRTILIVQGSQDVEIEIHEPIIIQEFVY